MPSLAEHIIFYLNAPTVLINSNFLKAQYLFPNAEIPRQHAQSRTSLEETHKNQKCSRSGNEWDGHPLGTRTISTALKASSTPTTILHSFVNCNFQSTELQKVRWRNVVECISCVLAADRSSKAVQVHKPALHAASSWATTFQVSSFKVIGFCTVWKKQKVIIKILPEQHAFSLVKWESIKAKRQNLTSGLKVSANFWGRKTKWLCYDTTFM